MEVKHTFYINKLFNQKYTFQITHFLKNNTPLN